MDDSRRAGAWCVAGGAEPACRVVLSPIRVYRSITAETDSALAERPQASLVQQFLTETQAQTRMLTQVIIIIATDAAAPDGSASGDLRGRCVVG